MLLSGGHPVKTKVPLIHVTGVVFSGLYFVFVCCFIIISIQADDNEKS